MNATNSTAKESSAEQPILSVRDLRTVFTTKRGKLVAVDGIDFDLFAGEVLGLVGESGSGKSVTLRSLIRLIQPPGHTSGEVWWQVDLEQPTDVGRVVVVGYYGDQRHYGYTVKTSIDGESWDVVADHRDNRAPSTKAGYVCRFEPRPVRYIRVDQPHNSANTGRHLVEVMAFGR